MQIFDLYCWMSTVLFISKQMNNLTEIEISNDYIRFFMATATVIIHRLGGSFHSKATAH